jgi:lactoylglutathione lyase
MKLLRKKKYPSGKLTLAFVGYGDEATHTVVELTYNWDADKYGIGNAFGHLALGVEDIYKTCDDPCARGAIVVREPGPMAPRRYPCRLYRRPPMATGLN